MPKRHSKPAHVDQHIIDLVNTTHPETVEELITQVQRKHSISEEEALNHIMNLQSQGKLVFRKPAASTAFTLANYLSSIQAQWYWLTIALSAITTVVVFTVPENAHPIVYSRYILGSIFALLLPGYSLIKALFPTKELDNVERIALSIGMSLALVPITGLVLNYTPWGIRLTPITLSLLALTITSATAAIIREYETKNTVTNE